VAPPGSPAFSQFRHGVKAGTYAGRVTSAGLGREPPRRHAATSPEVPRAVLHAAHVLVQEACGPG